MYSPEHKLPPSPVRWPKRSRFYAVFLEILAKFYPGACPGGLAFRSLENLGSDPEYNGYLLCLLFKSVDCSKSKRYLNNEFRIAFVTYSFSCIKLYLLLIQLTEKI